MEIFLLVTSPAYFGLALFLLARWVRGHVVRKAVLDHDLYEKDRVYNRKRPSYHDDLRVIAIQQRAQRALHKWKIPVKLSHVRKILEK